MPIATKTNLVKIQLPEHIAEHMRVWRAHGCFGKCPKSYVDFHKDLARKALESLSGLFTVHRQWEDGDGWFDGMEVVWAVVKHKRTSRLIKLQWHDGNQEFFASFESGGSSPLRFREF